MYPTVAIALLIAALQEQAAPPVPTYRSGVDVIRVEASVVDAHGKPLPDLTAGDFSVRIDGRDRKVLFARFSGPADAPDSSGTRSEPAGSYGTNVGSPTGRAIVFVVDLESIQTGNEKLILDTAARLVDALPSTDAVALVPIPGASIDLTREHARVTRALRTLRGTTPFTGMGHSFTATEVTAFEREHTDNVLHAISSIAERLALTTVSKSIVLISAGLAFETESLTRFRECEASLKRAAINVYALHVEQPQSDATDRRDAGAMWKDTHEHDHEKQTGVASVATMAGGEFFAAVGTAAGVFERVQARLASSYELAVQALPSDDDGKSHTVSVSLRNNPDAVVRWRREFIHSRPAAQPTRQLAQLMAQPFIVADLPIAAAVHTLRGDEATTVKAIVAATFGQGITVRPPVQYALTFRANDKAAFETDGTATLDGTRGRVVFAAQLTPGEYTMRLAAVDAAGRGGSLEVPIRVGLRAAGDLQMSDVILQSAGETATPALGMPAGAPLTASLELYAKDAARFASTTVRFEIRRGTAPAVLAATEATLAATELERKQIAQASVPTTTLSPGEYTVSAIVSADAKAIAKVSRRLIVTEATATVKEVTGAATPIAELPSAALATDPALDQVLRKVAQYVAAYGAKASVVVGVEQYTQHVRVQNSPPIPPRVLVAEFALVKTGGPAAWTGFRDVVEVNGASVRDRRDRLMKLLTNPSGTADDVWRIADESARYNVGPISRNFNVPTTALFFFHPANISRFVFTRKGTRTIDGATTWEIAFRETKRPTLIGTRAGKDVAAEGTIWVIPDDGTVVRTRLRLRGFADTMALGNPRGPATGTGSTVAQSPSIPSVATAQPGGSAAGAPPSRSGTGASASPGSSGGTSVSSSGGGPVLGGAPAPTIPDIALELPDEMPRMMEMRPIVSLAEIEVTYRRDDASAMWLPARMSEEYEGPIPRVRAEPLVGTSRTIATYSDFKKFETSAKVVTPK